MSTTSNKELKSKWDINVKVEQLELESSAQAYSSFHLGQPLKNRAALISHRVPKTNMHQPP